MFVFQTVFVSFQIPVHCQRDLDLGVVVTDKNGRKFDNISSLEFDWSMSDGSLASLADELQTEVTLTPSGRKVIESKFDNFLNYLQFHALNY
jgi:hypothetical protein